MADYIEPVKIEELPDKESLEDSDFFIAEDSEDTKKLTFEILKKYINDTVTIYFGLSLDAWKAPTHDITESAILGQGILGQMLLGDSAEWNTEFPTTLNHDDYIWVSFYVEHPNGETEWTTPFCLMDQDAKETIIEIQKELETAQADILKNSSLIAENSELLEEVSEKAAENTEQVDSLKTRIEQAENDIEQNTTDIKSNASSIEDIEKQLDGMTDLLDDNGIAIPENADLDEYTTPGKYYTPTTDIASTVKDVPYNKAAFTMFVGQIRAANSLYQLLIFQTSSEYTVWIRIMNASNFYNWENVMVSINNSTMGSADISGIGDGTITGAISENAKNIQSLEEMVEEQKAKIEELEKEIEELKND